ncbi:LysR substrate-binding domain-containing protein [Rhizobium sp. RAF56]|uniref:LysR substrate-binding domain-containing protein n=1 Tax=Rhizobium sp. RAF56 TaxID=3233062 RepID=UPI003F97F929
MKLSRQIPLNALRVFEAVARLASFTKAGEELGLTQTAVSYQIKLLEENIGEQLFLRRPRQIELTDTGKRLAPKIAEVFEMLAEVMASVRDDTEATLHIHTTPTFAIHWLARCIGSFQMHHPNIAVRLTTSDTLIDFSKEAADVAIRSGRGEWPGLRAHPLMKIDFTPMLHPKLAEAAGGIPTPADLLNLRIIDPEDPWWDLWLHAAGVADTVGTHPRNLLGAQTLAASAAMAGQGVAILTPQFYADDVAAGRLYQPFDLTCTDGRDYWLAYPENRRNVLKIKAFRNWILGEFGVAQD